MQFDEDGWLAISEEDYYAWLQHDALSYLTDLLAERYDLLMGEIVLIEWAEKSITKNPHMYACEEILLWAVRSLRAMAEIETLDRLWHVLEEQRRTSAYGH